MSNLVERLRTCVPCDEYEHVKCDAIFTEAANEIERLTEELHYCKGTCDLAMKHRDAAEVEIERLREREAELQAQLGFAESISALEIERLRGDRD